MHWQDGGFVPMRGSGDVTERDRALRRCQPGAADTWLSVQGAEKVMRTRASSRARHDQLEVTESSGIRVENEETTRMRWSGQSSGEGMQARSRSCRPSRFYSRQGA